MKRKPVKPSFATDKQIETLKEALNPQISANDLADAVKQREENLVKSRTSQTDYKSENLKINKELLSAQTAISQLQESITLKDAEISVYKEQHEILEQDLADSKNKIELFAKHLGESETELLHLKNTHSEMTREMTNTLKTLKTDYDRLFSSCVALNKEISTIKQKWYYRWFS